MAQESDFDISWDFRVCYEQFEEFMKTLDRDIQEKPRLRRLFEESSALETDSG